MMTLKQHTIIYLVLLCTVFNSCADSDNKSAYLAKDCDTTAKKLAAIAKEFSNSQKIKWEKIYDNYHKLDKEKAITEPINYFIAKSYIKNHSDPTLNQVSRPSSIDASNIIYNTKSLWIDKNAILALANSLIVSDTLNGIRVYFAQYDDNASVNDPLLDKKYNGMQTIIFMATRTSDNANVFHRSGKYADGLYIYDYNSLCPDICINADFN